ncbi:MAG: 4Fe-4S dicluster domain-containing protein [Anaerolineae bacterium]|nr:4Fe-4S dicluster domain-containing protein [Anaerolineae bacterium]
MATSHEPDLSFSRAVQAESGVPISRCYFCQKCTAGCPVAFAMDLKPAQMIRMIQLGQKEALLSSSAIWLCVNCQTCGTRCPNDIWLAPMFDTLRHMAIEAGYAPEPTVYALHRSFLDSIKMWGRVHEVTMLMEYKLRCLANGLPLFFRDLPGEMVLGSGLLVRGKLSFIPERVKGLSQVRALYETEAEEVSP